MSAEQSWRRHTNKPPGAVSKCPPSSLPAGLAVMDGDVSCVRKVLVFTPPLLQQLENRGIPFSVFPRRGLEGDPGVLRDSSHLLQKSGVLRTPAKSSAPARPPPQPQAVITDHSRAPGLSCCRHGDGIPPSSRK